MSTVSDTRERIDWRVPAALAWPGNEHALQKALLKVLTMERGTHPEVDEVFAVPNGGDRNRIVAAKLKAEGVRKGVPDLFLDVPRGGYHGLRLELKTAGGRPSQAQWEWLERYDGRGYRAIVCNDLETARDVVLGYLRGEMRRDERGAE